MNLSERIKTAIRERNTFSLSNDGVLTGDFGDIIPICCKEMVPTDNFTVRGQVFLRLLQMAAPTFGRIHGFVNHFFVPYRILMPEYHFEDSMTGGTDGEYPEDFPQITYDALFVIMRNTNIVARRHLSKMMSYLGLGRLAKAMLTQIEDEEQSPFNAGNFDDLEHSISLFPFLAIGRIYGDYYFPYGLEDDALVREALHKKYYGLIDTTYIGTAVNLTALEILFTSICSCYQKDYFTTAFTQPQRGAASVVTAEGTVDGKLDQVGVSMSNLATQDITAWQGQDQIKVAYDGFETTQSGTQSDNIGPRGDNANLSLKTPYAEFINSVRGIHEGVKANFTAHAVKWAESVQSFLERNNIAGGRYFEQMLARFGVKLKAEQLQRSQYLGGSDFWVSVGDITSTTSSSSPDGVQVGLGSQAGKGIALGKDTVSYRADEYGLFITLFHFVPETGYVDGLERMWTRRKREDFWTPELEDTGMQPILNKELNVGLTFTQIDGEEYADGVFGYVPRYAEYKFSNPVLGGDFILGSKKYSQALMDSYHLYRRIKDDDQLPVLNVDFVRVNPNGPDNDGVAGPGEMAGDYDRIFQYPNANGASFDHFLINTQISVGASRPMLGYAEAGMEFASGPGGNASVEVPYGGVRL